MVAEGSTRPGGLDKYSVIDEARADNVSPIPLSSRPGEKRSLDVGVERDPKR